MSDLKRINIHLGKRQIRALNRLAKATLTPRAVLIRRAVDRLLSDAK